MIPTLASIQIAACNNQVESTGGLAGPGSSVVSVGAGGQGGDSSGGAGGQNTGGAATGGGGQGGDPGCSIDEDCIGSSKGDTCDIATGECVECLPQFDSPADALPCGIGQYCNPTSKACEVGCTDNIDCPGGTLLCNLQTHQCAGCVQDSNCPAGSICIADTCIPGCSAGQPCQPGFSCCISTCYDLSKDEEHCGDCDTNCEPPPNAEPICNGGTCDTGLCHGVWEDCDNDPKNGCEQNTLQDGDCLCVPGAQQPCYFGAPGTQNVGQCKGGVQTCEPSGLSWGACNNQVLPASEICANSIDEDCDGIMDNAADLDGDGWTSCNGDCCELAANCGSPKLINPGAFEFVGDSIDNDCDAGTSDVVAAAPCSLASQFATVTADDVAKAMDVCQFTSANAPLPLKKWGVVSSTQILASGAPPNATQLSNMQNWQTAILEDYGTGGVIPKKGATMAGLSSGKMRDQNDVGYVDPNGGSGFASVSQPPAAYLAAHAGKLPASAGCSGNCPAGSGANDSVNTKLTIRVPTNAQSFSYSFRFFSAEYWTFQCMLYNDFYLAILQTGAPGLPADKNISFDSLGNPVSVNNGFFDVCVPKNCYTCPFGNGPLAGTGMQVGNTGGATAWLTTDSPIIPGETIVLELMIFDVSDHSLDSLVLLDNLVWNLAPATVGTHE